MPATIQPVQENDDDLQSMLDEFVYLVENECDDDDVERVTGMTKEELNRVLREDVGERGFDLSDDLRGKLAALFSEGEKESADELLEADRTIADLRSGLKSSRRTVSREQGAIVEEARLQMEQLLVSAENGAGRIFTDLERAEKADEELQMHDVRKSLEADAARKAREAQQSPFSKN